MSFGNLFSSSKEIEEKGKYLEIPVMNIMIATDTTHWNQAINSGASRVLPSLCPLSKFLLTNTKEMDTNLE